MNTILAMNGDISELKRLIPGNEGIRMGYQDPAFFIAARLIPKSEKQELFDAENYGR
ncbi:MAG: hypothetical protein GYA39_00505 [Methanothrix sp.]|nr:hypothetical protein [Methanothrix sp.]